MAVVVVEVVVGGRQAFKKALAPVLYQPASCLDGDI